MSDGSQRPLPDFAKTSRLVARALGMDAHSLASAPRHATLDDLPAIVALRQQLIGDEINWDDDAYLRWRYPLERAGHGRGALWVLYRGDELLAIIGVEDLPVAFGEGRATLYRPMDLLILPALRDAGLGLWLNQFMQQVYGNVLAVGANARSAGLVARAYEPLPDRRQFVRPILFDHFLANRWGHSFKSWLGAKVANVASAIHMHVVTWPGRGGLSASRVQDWPADLDGFLAKARSSRRVEVERSRAYWAWRLGTPRARFDIWAARGKAGTKGLMVTRRDMPEPGRKAWMIMDLVLDGEQGLAALRALLREVLLQAATEGVEYVVWVGYRHDVEPEFQRCGFILRPEDGRAMSWRCTDDALVAFGLRHPDWTFCELHTDGA